MVNARSCFNSPKSDDDVMNDGVDDDGLDRDRIADVINDGVDDYGIDDGTDGVIGDGIDGEGEPRYEMLWTRNWRKVEYAGAKMMVSVMVWMMALVMIASMMMLSMMASMMVL
jgi:hypothetical protein